MKELLEELKGFQKRKNRKEKTEFIHYLKDKLKDYDVKVNEKEKVRNVETLCEDQKITIMAHYNTGSKMPLIPRLFNRLFGTGIGNNIFYPILFIVAILMTFFPILKEIIAWIWIIFLVDTLFFSFIPNKNNMNDNTSGVLLLLNLAERLKTMSYKNQIKLVFVDREGLYKVKKQFVHESDEELRSHIFLNFDNIGQGSTLFLLSGYNRLENIDFNNEVKEKLKFAFKSHMNQVKIAESNNRVLSKYCSFYIGMYEKSLTRMGYYIPHIRSHSDRTIDLEIIQSIENSTFDFIQDFFKKSMRENEDGIR